MNRPLVIPETEADFLQRYPSDVECANLLTDVRWAHGFVCPNEDRHGGESKERRSYWTNCRGVRVCRECEKEVTVLSGTYLHNTRLSPTKIMLAVWYITNPATAKTTSALMRHVGISDYQTGRRLITVLRQAMGTAGPWPLKDKDMYRSGFCPPRNYIPEVSQVQLHLPNCMALADSATQILPLLVIAETCGSEKITIRHLRLRLLHDHVLPSIIADIKSHLIRGARVYVTDAALHEDLTGYYTILQSNSSGDSPIPKLIPKIEVYLSGVSQMRHKRRISATDLQLYINEFAFHHSYRRIANRGKLVATLLHELLRPQVEMASTMMKPLSPNDSTDDIEAPEDSQQFGAAPRTEEEFEEYLQAQRRNYVMSDDYEGDTEEDW